jgi:large subunit ribosomal protein L29
MKINRELKGLSEKELKARLEEFKKELFKLNSKAATGNNPDSPGAFRQTKKNIARIKTLLREKELIK